MAPRAIWKGFLKIGEVNCPVSLYTAASTSERVSFHTLNRETGNRVRRRFVDSETGKPVGRDDQVKGYEIASDEYVLLEPEEIAAAVPDSDKTLNVAAFVACDQVDDVYFDKPYYLTPSEPGAEEAFALIREGMRAKNVAALARTVLFKRCRTVLVRAQGQGLVATTMNFDYEVRAAAEVFEEVPDLKLTQEMLELAEHIIKTKRGAFDPAAFDDRYDDALAELVKAKLAGRKIKPRKVAGQDKVIDLMEALRESAGRTGSGKKGRDSSKSRSKTSGGKATGAKTATKPSKTKKAAKSKTSASAGKRKAG